MFVIFPGKNEKPLKMSIKEDFLAPLHFFADKRFCSCIGEEKT
jgi:hypothetical protein